VYPQLPIPVAVLMLCVVAAAGATGSPGSAPAERTSAATPPMTVSFGGRALAPGEVVRVDVDCACEGAALQVAAFGRTLPLVHLGGTRWQGLVGIDVGVAPGAYPLVVSSVAGPPGALYAGELQVLPKQFRTRTLRVAEAYVSPPAAVTARIAREAKALETIFGGVTDRRWEGPFVAPVPGPSADNFGARTVFNGQPRRPHAGLDYRAATGTPVKAPAAGRVVLAEDLYFTGGTVILDHGHGLFSLFAHLSAIGVQHGALVAAGAPVGKVGATGRSTGPHLHWGVRLHGARVDPLSLLAATGTVGGR
jgi:murein DD-endopeptidase MepM/ murein hydrolase activator NlpD